MDSALGLNGDENIASLPGVGAGRNFSSSLLLLLGRFFVNDSLMEVLGLNYPPLPRGGLKRGLISELRI